MLSVHAFSGNRTLTRGALALGSARSTHAFVCFVQEPDDQEAPDEHDSSPPEDTALYPHSPGTQYQQVTLPLLYLSYFCGNCDTFKFSGL